MITGRFWACSARRAGSWRVRGNGHRWSGMVLGAGVGVCVYCMHKLVM